MNILVAEDNQIQRHLICRALQGWGYEVVECSDGEQTWRILGGEGPPPIVILDWMMPGITGLEICQRLRAEHDRNTYAIMLTARGNAEDQLAGLRAGADDYVHKPFHPDELNARIRNAVRVVELQAKLQGRVRELEDALRKVRQLQELLPICSYCKKVRQDENYWNDVEAYFQEHANVRFSHGICPECYDGIIKPELERWETDTTNAELPPMSVVVNEGE